MEDMLKLHKKQLSKQMRTAHAGQIRSFLPKDHPMNNKQGKSKTKRS